MVAVAVIGLLVTPAQTVACLGTALIGDDPTDPDADVIFSGTAVRVEDPRAPGDPLAHSFDLMSWTFAVDGVEKGSAWTEMTVRTPRAEGSCGVTFELGNRYRVVATDLGNGLEAWSTGGTAELDADAPPIGQAPAERELPTPAIAIGVAAVVLTAYLFSIGGGRDKRGRATEPDD